MKNTRLTSIISSSVIACALMVGSLATRSASAESPTVLAKVNIPFDFRMGNQTLPAGTYIIDREAAHILLLRGTNGAKGFVLTNEASRVHPSNHGTVVFAHYGDKYFLRQIWQAGSTSGLECPKTRAEKAAVVAENKQPASTTELAFNTEPLK